MRLSEKLDDQIEAALEHLIASIKCGSQKGKSHMIIKVTGWEGAAKTCEAIATYFVGLRACAVDAALKVRARLNNTKEDRVEVRQNVEAIVGSTSKPLSTSQKLTERNPWLAEGLWHLCLFLAKKRSELHTPGKVIALDMPHVQTKDHGIDVCAIYDSGKALGLTLVETKAYKSEPSTALQNAATFFLQVDKGKHDLRIRHAVHAMRSALPSAKQQLVTPSFWKKRRAYIANPHCDSACACDCIRSRKGFTRLAIKKWSIIIMPHEIVSYDQFFDDISNAMRAIALKL
jgi:hypothetical protein